MFEPVFLVAILFTGEVSQGDAVNLFSHCYHGVMYTWHPQAETYIFDNRVKDCYYLDEMENVVTPGLQWYNENVWR